MPTPRCAPRGREDHNSHNAARDRAGGEGAAGGARTARGRPAGWDPDPRRGSALVVRWVTRGPTRAARSVAFAGAAVTLCSKTVAPPAQSEFGSFVQSGVH